ncbi:MAG: hypothetical protein JW864_06515 [Spirochaetes bacterium]|nr:hypothetical protein [Spirochaetota bacterium]
MKRFYIIISVLYSILGIIHTAFTPVFYNMNSVDALWFAGTGFGLLFLGLLNLAGIKSNDKLVFNLCISANIISAFLNIFITVMILEPQAFIGIILNLILLAESVFFRIKLNR